MFRLCYAVSNPKTSLLGLLVPASLTDIIIVEGGTNVQNTMGRKPGNQNT